VSPQHRHGSDECKEVFAKLSEYLDSELDQELCSRLEKHLEGCPPCVDFLESLRHTVGLVGAGDAPALSDEDRRRICEAYRRLRGST
jgi:anti-sigma factor (TIGR02949 family)